MPGMRFSKPNMVSQTNSTVLEEYSTYLKMLVAGLQRGVMIICGKFASGGGDGNPSPLRGSQGKEGRRKGRSKGGRLGLLVKTLDLLMAPQ